MNIFIFLLIVHLFTQEILRSHLQKVGFGLPEIKKILVLQQNISISSRDSLVVVSIYRYPQIAKY